MLYWLIMPAAGSGRRFGSAKQYALLGTHTVLETALQLFIQDPQCAGGAVVLAADDPYRAEIGQRLPTRFALVTGGSERAHSVCNGLMALTARAAADDWVLVHDAARPCLSAADLARLLQHAAGERVGALLAVPIADTVRRAEPAALSEAAAAIGPGAPVATATLVPPAPRSIETLSRDSLWLAQTPQMFRYAPLRHALEQAIAQQRAPTDEAQAMEWQGFSARLVQSRDNNLKVTSSADLLLAQAILTARERTACG